jgi:hypothetical protein
MYFQKVPHKQKILEFYFYFFGIFKVTDQNSRIPIRICTKISRIYNTSVQTDKFDIDNLIFCGDSLLDLLNFVC